MNKRPARKTLFHLSRALAFVWLGILFAAVIPGTLGFKGNLSGIAEASATRSVSSAHGTDRVHICHRTGSEHNPYVEITIDRSALPDHVDHGDIYPVPATGCPAGTSTATDTPVPNATSTDTPTPVEGTATPVEEEERVSICHRTGSEHNPYVEITVDRSALPHHLAHGDIYPVPATGCPAGVDPPTNTPEATDTPQSTNTPPPANTATPVEERVSICHRTGSEHNPYVEITINRSALPHHLAHGDIYPVPATGCPAGPGRPSVTPEPTRQTTTPTYAPTNTQTAISTSTPVPPTNTPVRRRPRPSNTPESTSTPLVPTPAGAVSAAEPPATSTVVPVAAVQPAPPVGHHERVAVEAPRAAAVAPAVAARVAAVAIPARVSASVLPITGKASNEGSSLLVGIVLAAAILTAGVYLRRRRARSHTEL